MAIPDFVVTERRRMARDRVRVTARFGDGTLVTTTVTYANSTDAGLARTLGLGWLAIDKGRRF